MYRKLFTLTILAVFLWSTANAASLVWDANSESNLAGYKVYLGTASQIYTTPIDVGKVTTYQLSGLTPGVTYYFVVTAYNISGAESGFSNEVTYTEPGQQPIPVAATNVAVAYEEVIPVNHPPVAEAQSITTVQNIPKVIVLVASDVDGDSLTYSVVTAPVHATLSGLAPNLIYTPVAGYTGSDNFTFKVNDGKLDSNTATVSVSVTAPPSGHPVQDNFNSNTSGNYLSILQGMSWSSTYARGNGGVWQERHYVYHKTPVGSQNHYVQAKLKFATTNISGLVLSSNGSGKQGYVIYRWPSDTTSIRLGTFNSPTDTEAEPTTVATWSFTGGKTWESNIVHLVKCSVSGNDFHLYIDWNDDGDFLDGNEDLGIKTSSTYRTSAYQYIGLYFNHYSAIAWLDDLEADIL